MSENNTVLVVAAHPDDEVLGAGGTIARLAREGHEVCIAVLGEGMTGRLNAGENADHAQLDALHECCRQVGRQLGAGHVVTYRLPDNRFDTVPLLDVVKIVEELIDRFHPQSIYTHFAGDLNIDHAIAHRAVLTAARPMAGRGVRDIYAFEVPSSTEWAFGQFEQAFVPNVFVNIADTLEVKIAAMQQYETEARPFPHPRSPESLRARAAYWGSTVGIPAAEAFQIIRGIV